MIKTNKSVVYDARTQREGFIYIKMEHPELAHEIGVYIIPIIDYLVDEEGNENRIWFKTVRIPVNIYDALNEQIIQGYGILGTSVEKLTQAMPYALLEYVKNDIVDADNNTLIYGTVAADWELIPT